MSIGKLLEIEDRFARTLLIWLTPIACLLLVLPSIVAFISLVTTSSIFTHDYFTFSEPPPLENIRSFIFSFKPLPAEVLNGGIQVLPAFLLAVAVKAGLGKTLTWVGRLIVLIFIVGIASALFTICSVDPISMGSNFAGGEVGLQKIVSTNELILKLCFTYLALLLGIRWPQKKHIEEE